MDFKILPSLLAADMGNLESATRQAADSGADALHLDIMDGHFVPNIGMGPAVVEMARRCVSLPRNVHLMLSRPDKHVERFIEAGADTLLIHIEADCDVPTTLEHIRSMGCRPGITLNPETPAESVFSVLPAVDEVLCMTVHPGYGGQSFMPEVLPKLKKIRNKLNQMGVETDLMVDGGVSEITVVSCAEHGANVFVSGTNLFTAEDMAAQVALLRDKATAAARNFVSH